ncbi:helix-turn-helix transcriptional regulator [Fructilactobacillus vespulae]|uniref:helix-turn-helix domain-containing protein n=1 Tax=Fructilactobacillus vespulae TaxID=1249630 RepID=UPI0039B5B6B9
MNVAENLKEARQAAGLTQVAVAQAMNVSRKTISSWETGRSMPSIDIMQELAKLYHTTPNQLLGETEANSAKEEAISYRTRLIRYKRWGYISKYAFFLDLFLILGGIFALLTPFDLKNLWIVPVLIIDLSVIFLYESNWKTITTNQPLMRKIMIVIPLIFLAVFATGWVLNNYIYTLSNPTNLAILSCGLLILAASLTGSIVMAIIFPLKRLTVKKTN